MYLMDSKLNLEKISELLPLLLCHKYYIFLLWNSRKIFRIYMLINCDLTVSVSGSGSEGGKYSWNSKWASEGGKEWEIINNNSTS